MALDFTTTPEAIANYERAADVGDAEAQFALGVLHSSGFGAARDQPLATTFLHFAAEGGAVGAQLALGYRHLLASTCRRRARRR